VRHPTGGPGARLAAARRAVPWTPGGASVLVAAGACYLTGSWLHYPELCQVAAGLAGLVLLATALVLRRPRLTVSRDIEPARTTAGTAALAHLTVLNRSPLPTPALRVEDRLGQARVPTATGPVAPHGRRDLYYLVEAPRRGVFTVGPVTVERGDPFGLARRAQSFPSTARELWVHPRVHPMAPLPVTAVLDEDLRPAVLPSGTRASSSSREYVAGDDPRHVHWRLSARTGTLMVREREEARQPAVTVLLDTRAAVWDDDDRFDQACEIAASAVAANQTGPHPAELIVAGEASPAGALGALDRLAAAAPSVGTSLVDLVLAAERGAGDALVLVTGEVADGLVSRVAALRRRYAPVVVIELAAGRPVVARPRVGLLVLRAPDAAAAAAAFRALLGSGEAA